MVAQFADAAGVPARAGADAIDAGSPSIEIELRHDAAAAALRAIVRDRGDRDPTKIGKFGIGFSSVLAPGPRVVVVDTVRAGRRLVLHLHPDLTYQLFEGGPATRSGTTVELELPISRPPTPRWCGARSRWRTARVSRSATTRRSPPPRRGRSRAAR